MQGRASGTSERKVYGDVFTQCILFRHQTAPMAQPRSTATKSDLGDEHVQVPRLLYVLPLRELTECSSSD